MNANTLYSFIEMLYFIYNIFFYTIHLSNIPILWHRLVLLVPDLWDSTVFVYEL